MAPPRQLRPVKDVPARIGLAEYVWSPATSRDSPDLRSATRVIQVGTDDEGCDLPRLEEWSVQETRLAPCHYLPDPRRPQPAWLVLCEPHLGARALGARADLRRALAAGGRAIDTHLSFRLIQPGLPGPALAERWLLDCVDSGIMVSGQEHVDDNWVLTIGWRDFGEGIDPYEPGPLVVADHVHLARHLLERAALETGFKVPDWQLELIVTTGDLRSGKVKASDLRVAGDLEPTNGRADPLQLQTVNDNAHTAVLQVLNALTTTKP